MLDNHEWQYYVESHQLQSSRVSGLYLYEMCNSLLRNHFNKKSGSSFLIHQRRRILSRNSSSAPSSSPSPSSFYNIFHYSSRSSSHFSLYNIFHHSLRTSSPEIRTLTKRLAQEESDAECWERMLALQMEYHCYNSARLEAAVHALGMGYSIEEVPIRKSA